MSIAAAPSPASLLSEADQLLAADRFVDAIELLHAANRAMPDPDLEARLAEVRYEAFGHIHPASRFDSWPVPVADLDPSAPAQIPQVAPADLDAEAVRRGIRGHGGVHVPGLLDKAQVDYLVEGIEYVLALRDATQGPAAPDRSSWFRSLPLPMEEAATLARNWVAGDGGILMCDSPRLLDTVLSIYEDVGLKQVVSDYLGEQPVLSANKATLRRARLEGKTDWHQDGAFLGTGIRALNVWVALTDCGVDSPGMDLVPRRFEEVQETGTGGSIFDWAVGPQVVAELSADHPVVRPEFRAGDAMLFDELYLHRTALSPEMTHPRHALESWFFAPSDYPDGQVPLVW